MSISKQQSVASSFKYCQVMASSWGLIAIGVITLIPYGFANSTKNFPKLNINTRSECPTNNIDIWVKLHNISCQNGFNLGCIPNANNSTEILLFCKPVDLKCQAGTRGVFAESGNIVTMTEEECPPGTYQKQESDCVNACYQKRTDFFQIPEEFALYSNGSNTEPPQIYCNASAGWYNNKNKTFFDFVSDFTYELGYNIICLNVKDRKPCVDGLFVLPNGSCVDQQRRDNYMLQLQGNINVDAGQRYEVDKVFFHPVNTTAEPTSYNKTTGLALVSQPGGLPVWVYIVIVVVILAAGAAVGIVVYCLWRYYQNTYNEVLQQDDKYGEKTGEKFKKKCSENLSEDRINRLQRLTSQVGALVYSNCQDGTVLNFLQGTVFRVGEKYVMTALHVISNFIAYRDQSAVEVVDIEMLTRLDRNEDLYVYFGSYLPTHGYPEGQKFKLEYCHHIASMDLIILEIHAMSTNNVLLPEPVIMAKRDRIMSKVNVIGYGHPDEREIKHVDLSCNVILKSDPVIQKAIQNLDKKKNKFGHISREILNKGYKGYEVDHVILYHGFLEHGSSGAPLFYWENGYEQVVGVVLEGLPKLYFHLDKNKKHLIPDEYVFFVALKTSAIYNALMETGKADLASKLFG